MTIPVGLGFAASSFTLAQLNVLSAAGVKFIRIDTGWDGIETSLGVYNFTTLDTNVNNILTAGLQPLLILDYNSTLYAASKFTGITTAPNLAAWLNFVTAVVNRYKNHNVVYEVWNEPNSSSFWISANPNEYSALLIATSPVIKATDSTASVIGPALSEIHLDYLETCFIAGILPYIDALSIHPYIRSGPEDATSGNYGNNYTAIRALLTRYGYPNMTLFSSEWGYSSLWNPGNAPHLGYQTYPPVTEAVQAQYFPRQYMINQMNNVKGSVWFTNNDTGSLNITFEDDGFGTFRTDGTTTKPSYTAMINMAPVLGKNYLSNLASVSGEYMPVFLDPGAGLDCIAYRTTGAPHQTTIPLPAGYTPSVSSVSLTNTAKAISAPLTTSKTPPAASINSLKVTITGTPQYVSLNYA